MKSSARRLAALVALSVLAACGGGGGGGGEDHLQIDWQQGTYTVTTDSNSSATYVVNAAVTVQGPDLPPILAIDLAPYGMATNPTPGSGPFFMNSTHTVPVQFAIQPSGAGPGGYPIGSHVFTATAHIGSETLTATTTLVVR